MWMGGRCPAGHVIAAIGPASVKLGSALAAPVGWLCAQAVCALQGCGASGEVVNSFCPQGGGPQVLRSNWGAREPLEGVLSFGFSTVPPAQGARQRRRVEAERCAPQHWPPWWGQHLFLDADRSLPVANRSSWGSAICPVEVSTAQAWECQPTVASQSVTEPST